MGRPKRKYWSPAFGNSLFDRCHYSQGRKIVVSFTTEYAVPRQMTQINFRILELSIGRRLSNSCIVFIFVRLLSCRFGRTTRLDCRSFKSFFHSSFSIFKSRGITRPSVFPEAKPRGTLRVSGKQNSLFPLGPVIKCLITHENSHCFAQ